MGNGRNGAAPEPPVQDEELKEKAGKPPKPTEDELGTRFIRQHRADYAYLYGQWHTYADGVWAVTETEHLKSSWEVLRDAKEQGIRPNNSLAENILKYAALYMRPAEEQLDHTDYINLLNGIYNVRTQELEPHNRQMYFTSQLPFQYDPAATCPTWEKFLRTVIRHPNGQPDGKTIDFLQEAFGYSLTASTDHRVSFWLWGPSGTGKSTLINVLVALAGDSHTSIDLKYLGKNEYQLADLAGKRVVTFAEPSANTVLSDGDYKRLVSQDIINARNPYGKWIRFTPQCKVWGAMNHLPAVADRSDGVFSRVKIIPMKTIIPHEQRDPGLIGKLYDELPGIFNWAMEGWMFVKGRGRGGLLTSPAIEREVDAFRNENDTEAAFVDDWCYRKKGASTQASHLYKAYRWWCDANGYRPKSSRKAARDWERLGFTKRKNSVVYYDGVQLKPEDQRE